MEKIVSEKTENILPRPPIVVVMGHIDHGKTTLLDYIRKSSVAVKETGGITQRVGAYEVEYNSHRIIFLDTPGHEAFSKMRSRGANVADIAVLVVAADDGVKPQTREALFAIKTAGVDFVVAINKIDKQTADVERVKNDLAEEEVFLEGRGGAVPFVEISAKEGKNIDKLLETILLMAEIQELKSDTLAAAEGVVIESHLDPRRGITSTLLIRKGILKKGEFVVAGDSLAKVKIFENFAGNAIKEASSSDPVRVIGFDKLPAVGAEFKSFKTQKEAIGATLALSTTNIDVQKNIDIFSENVASNIILGLVIKTDVTGSCEAILHEIEKIKNKKVDLKVLRAEAGDVSEDDIKIASSAQIPIIIAFGVMVRPAAKDLAERMNIEVLQFKIIYEISDFLKKRFLELVPVESENTSVGHAKIVKIFPAKTLKGQVVGGIVMDGLMRRGAGFYLLRRENKIGSGKIENLQSGKINIAEILEDSEFGALLSIKATVAVGDILEVIA